MLWLWNGNAVGTNLADLHGSHSSTVFILDKLIGDVDLLPTIAIEARWYGKT